MGNTTHSRGTSCLHLLRKSMSLYEQYRKGGKSDDFLSNNVNVSFEQTNGGHAFMLTYFFLLKAWK